MHKSPHPAAGASIDVERLTALRRYVDPKAGIAEEFLAERLGPERAFALRSAPLEGERPDVWIVCPAVGPEHGNLRRLETLVARSLAGAGVGSLRIRPDVGPDGAIGPIDLDARLAEVADATAQIRAAGSRVAGALGAVSGALVAALACERLGLDSLVMIEPVRRGRQYVRETLRRQAVNDLIAAPGADETPAGQSPLRRLEATGATTVRGLRLERSAYERLAATDLVDDVRSYTGRSLLVGISPTGAASAGLSGLATHLRALGGDVTVHVLDARVTVPLGEYYYENVGFTRVDTRLELDLQLAELTTSWIAASSPSPQAA